jgi:uncharacterized phiE125 gp8 family phage protein
MVVMADYNSSIVTAPATEPVSVAEVKNSLRIDHGEDDALIGALITAARSGAEAYTRRAFITQTWKMYKNGFSDYSEAYPWRGPYVSITSMAPAPNNIEIPMAPLQSITHLKTYDDNDVASTFAASNYFVSTYPGDFAQPGSLTLRDSSVWPTVYRVKDGVEIQFVAGYGDNITDVPKQIRMAIQEEAGFLYQNRLTCDGGLVSSGVARSMLSQFRVIKL